MNSDLIELLQCLSEFKVRYLLIGGHAVGVHSEPRYTKDLDIWIEASKANAKRLIAALNKFGAPTNSIAERDFAKPGTLFIFGIEPNRVDVLNQIKGAQFKSAFSRRLTIELQGVLINCISLPDLIHLKKLANRPQDRADLVKLRLTEKLLKRSGKRQNKKHLLS